MPVALAISEAVIGPPRFSASSTLALLWPRGAAARALAGFALLVGLLALARLAVLAGLVVPARLAVLGRLTLGAGLAAGRRPRGPAPTRDRAAPSRRLSAPRRRSSSSLSLSCCVS